jgi:hypothetical protein
MHTTTEPTANPILRDRFGVRFTPGQVVTYPVRTGSSLYTVTAVVAEVFVDCLQVRPLSEQRGQQVYAKRQALTNIDCVDRVTALPHVKAKESLTGKYEILTTLIG